MDDNLMACVNTMGLNITSHNNIFIPHTYQMVVTENKNDNELNVFADSLINLVLVRDNGQTMKYTFMRSIPDVDNTKFSGKDNAITMQELPEMVPTMVLMCAEPSSLMSQRYRDIMDTSLHLELITEDDDILSRYGSAKWRRCIRSNEDEDCVFFAGPCTGVSPWNRLNKRVSNATAHMIHAKARLYWKLWEEFSTCLLRVMELEAMALLELLTGCDYWHDERMKFMINGTESHIHDFDGCMYGLTTQFGDHRIPIKKPWRIVSWGVKFNVHKQCDRKHDHGKCEGRETKITQTYTSQIVNIIFKTVRRQMTIRFKESLSKLDETCSHCRHDQRPAKRIAVSVIIDMNDIAGDQLWLRKYITWMYINSIGLESSGYPLARFQLSTASSTSPAVAAPARWHSAPELLPVSRGDDGDGWGGTMIPKPRRASTWCARGIFELDLANQLLIDHWPRRRTMSSQEDSDLGKTFLLTDLRYRCTSNTGGMRNIQYGLDDLGYAVGVLTSQQLHGRVKGPKVLRRGRVPEE